MHDSLSPPSQFNERTLRLPWLTSSRTGKYSWDIAAILDGNWFVTTGGHLPQVLRCRARCNSQTIGLRIDDRRNPCVLPAPLGRLCSLELYGPSLQVCQSLRGRQRVT